MGIIGLVLSGEEEAFGPRDRALLRLVMGGRWYRAIVLERIRRQGIADLRYIRTSTALSGSAFEHGYPQDILHELLAA